MPRVHTQKAAKDYPDQGISKGETYYSWSFRYGGSYKSKTYPRPSQLTQSKLSGAYSAQEAMEDAIGAATCISDITDAIDQCVSDINDVAQEYRDSKDNMPEGLQEGPTGQECEEKADALEEYASELESARDEIDGLEACEYLDEDTRKSAFRLEIEDDDDDVDVIDRDSLDAEHQALHEKRWLVESANGSITYFDTEAEACDFQRGHRATINRDPDTGERSEAEIDAEVDRRYDELNSSAGFDDLEPEEAEAMLDAAREFVNNVSLSI